MLRFFRRNPRRRGAILLLTVFLLIFLLGIIAFSVDLGYVLLAKTQLQTAADSAALAAAATMGSSQDESISTGVRFAGLNKVGEHHVVLKNSDVVYGTWDPTNRVFTPVQNGISNAVKVTTRADNTTSGTVPLFFGAVFNQHSVDAQASAVATCNPRDICFVVDLSSSMNDDTDPANTSTINASFPGVGTQMMQDLYDDLGYGTYPGTAQAAGAPLGANSITTLSSATTSPLLYSKRATILSTYHYTVPSQYMIYVTGDGSGQAATSSSARTTKAYSWVIDEQLAGKSGQTTTTPLGIMKKAKPTLDSASNYSYWQNYISSNGSALGYKSYVAAVEPKGRDVKVLDGTKYSPMSVNSPDCPYHVESTDGGNFNFPPREMPTHSARRAMIGAINVVKERNQVISNVNQRDWVSIVSYDTQTGVMTVRNLGYDYDAAMAACCTLQSCGAGTSCTATETGLSYAENLLTTTGRVNTNKVVVLLTDGKPNLYSSSNTTISSYRTAHANSNFYGGTSSYPQDAAIMQASIMQGKNWMFFPVCLGLESDGDFMNRIYTVAKGKTGQTDVSPYSANGDPTTYETQLRNLFDQIISTPRIRIVQ
jgi:Flp pilus assembly protein TadG